MEKEGISNADASVGLVVCPRTVSCCWLALTLSEVFFGNAARGQISLERKSEGGVSFAEFDFY